MPRQRSRKAHGAFIFSIAQHSRRGIVEDNAKLALILAAEFTHLERTRLRRSFPVHVADGILGLVFANAMQIRPATTHKALPLAAHSRQNLKKFVGRLDPRIDQNFARQRHVARLGEKRERKTRSHAEAAFPIAAALLKQKFKISRQFLARRQKRKISYARKNSRRVGSNRHPPQTPVRQSQPLFFLRAVERERERHWLPLPLFLGLRPPLARGEHKNRKRRQVTPRIAQHNASRHRATRKHMFRQADIEFQPAQHHRRNYSGNQNRRQHSRDHNVEQIISRVERGDPDHQRDQHIHDAGAVDFIVKRFPQPLDRYPARKIRHGDQPHDRGHHQRSRGQNHGRPNVAGVARHGREKSGGKRQPQPSQREQELHPHFRRGRLQPLHRPAAGGAGTHGICVCGRHLLAA